MTLQHFAWAPISCLSTFNSLLSVPKGEGHRNKQERQRDFHVYLIAQTVLVPVCSCYFGRGTVVLAVFE